MPDLTAAEPPERSGSPTVAEMLSQLTWEQITEDGVITLEEVEDMLRAKGIDPNEGYEEMYGANEPSEAQPQDPPVASS